MKSGTGKSAVPVGVIIAVCLLLVRACTTMTNSRTSDPRPKTPAVMPKLRDNVEFRMVKDKGLEVVPKNAKDVKPPGGWPGKDAGKSGVAEPSKR
jgi:hypothetical protein